MTDTLDWFTTPVWQAMKSGESIVNIDMPVVNAVERWEIIGFF